MASRLTTRKFEVIISGGGIVGFSLLNLLKKSQRLQGHRILLLEQGVNPSKQSKSKNEAQKTVGNLNGKEKDPFHDGPMSDGSEFSNRVSSITPSSQEMLRKIGVWNRLAPYAKNVKTIRTWNYRYEDKTEFKQIKQPGIGGPMGEGVLFSVLENRRLLSALVDNLPFEDNENLVEWRCNLENVGQSQDGDGMLQISGKNSESGEDFHFKTPLLIGCDGFKSSVRKFSGLKYYEYSLGKSAIVGTVEVEPRFMGDANDVAYQRFSANNDTVLALLPLNDCYSSFVVSAPTSFADHLCTIEENAFLESFNQLLSEANYADNFILQRVHDVANIALDGASTLAERFFGMRTRPTLTLDNSDFWSDSGSDAHPPYLRRLVHGSRASYPLFFGTTSPKMVGKLPRDQYNRIALIGDAAHRLHPLAGQGLNLGLADAWTLFEQLDQSLANGEDLFNGNDGFPLARALHRFECQRQASIIPMLAAVQTLPTLFALAPSKALTMLNSCSAVKEAAVRFAN